MNRIPVLSSTMASVGYDPKTQTLEIEFHGGTVYEYFDVPQSVYEAFISAESKGAFFNASVKGVYRYAKL